MADVNIVPDGAKLVAAAVGCRQQEARRFDVVW